MARTILARRTWDQGKESLWAAACSASASRRAIVNLSGRRPRIRAASHAVRADRQHRRPVEFIARVVSGDTRGLCGPVEANLPGRARRAGPGSSWEAPPKAVRSRLSVVPISLVALQWA